MRRHITLAPDLVLVAGPWSRVRRKAAAPFVTGALIFVVGACGNVQSSTPENDAARALPTDAPVIAGPTLDDYDTTYETPQKAPRSADADRQFGHDAVADGWALAQEILMDHSYRQDLFLKRTVKAKDFASAMTLMTDDCRTDFLRDLERANTNPNKHASIIQSLTVYNADGKYQDGPSYINPRIAKPRVFPVVMNESGRDGLGVSANVTVDLRMIDKSGEPILYPLIKSATLWLVPSKVASGNTEWKLDGYRSTFKAPGQPRPGTGQIG